MVADRDASALMVRAAALDKLMRLIPRKTESFIVKMWEERVRKVLVFYYWEAESALSIFLYIIYA